MWLRYSTLGRVEGDYFYAMEFVEGESLDRVLRSRGPLEVGLALEIVNQVAGALGAGYRKGLVHRDIKPANLMVVFEEPGEVTVKVIDYGLVRTAQGAGRKACRAAAKSESGEAERFIGTPQFASPEQCEGKDTDIRSDLYSLGVTLWVMLSGKLPFEGRFSEVIEKHQVEPPPFEQLEHVPALVVSLLQFLLEKDPRKRPQTPLELRARVREVQKAVARRYGARGALHSLRGRFGRNPGVGNHPIAACKCLMLKMKQFSSAARKNGMRSWGRCRPVRSKRISRSCSSSALAAAERVPF